MTSFFPDVNVWLALSVAGHVHSPAAWRWLNQLTPRSRLIFCRVTQLGLLRLLSNKAVMGDLVLPVDQAWGVYDRWLKDPRVEFQLEPRDLDAAFREATRPFRFQRAAKGLGDCYLLACAKQSDAVLVTLDPALLQMSRTLGQSAINPA